MRLEELPYPRREKVAGGVEPPVRSGRSSGKEAGPMAHALLDKVPQALKSMYHAENALRRALFKGVMLRTDEAREHLVQARRHLDEMLGSRQPERVNPSTSTESDKAAPLKDGEF